MSLKLIGRRILQHALLKRQTRLDNDRQRWRNVLLTRDCGSSHASLRVDSRRQAGKTARDFLRSSLDFRQSATLNIPVRLQKPSVTVPSLEWT